MMCFKVSSGVEALTATNSMSLYFSSSKMARRTHLPILPNPLIATFVVIFLLSKLILLDKFF